MHHSEVDRGTWFMIAYDYSQSLVTLHNKGEHKRTNKKIFTYCRVIGACCEIKDTAETHCRE